MASTRNTNNIYALHVFYDDAAARAGCEAYLERHFDIINLSKIPTRAVPGDDGRAR